MNTKTNGEQAAALFRAAAALIGKGLLLLDTGSVDCPSGCGDTHVLKANLTHWRANERLEPTVTRLTEEAEALERVTGRPSPGYRIARNWYLEHGADGPTVQEEAVALIQEARAALDAPHVPDGFRTDLDRFIATVTGTSLTTTRRAG